MSEALIVHGLWGLVVLIVTAALTYALRHRYRDVEIVTGERDYLERELREARELLDHQGTVVERIQESVLTLRRALWDALKCETRNGMARRVRLVLAAAGDPAADPSRYQHGGDGA